MKDMTLETPPKSDKRKWEPCLIVNYEGEKFNCWGYKTISPHLMVTPMMATQQDKDGKALLGCYPYPNWTYGIWS